MKIKFLILLSISLLFIFACDDGIKFDNPNDEKNKAAVQQGELGGECYPNKTCDEGLTCDKESNTCIEESESSENNDDSDMASEQSDGDNDTDTTHDSSDSVPDNDTDIDSGDSKTDDDADNDSGDSTTDNDTDTDTIPADPCTLNPCSSIANSTGECSIFGGTTYKCECNSNYYWDGSTCQRCSCDGKMCGDDGCGNICGVCQGEDMGCSADQTQCVKYECAQVTITKISINPLSTLLTKEKFYYFNHNVSDKKEFYLKIQGLSMAKNNDLAEMTFQGNCNAAVDGTPIPGTPENSSVCFFMQDNSTTSNTIFFPDKGSLNITTLTSTGDLSAKMSGIRLVEIDKTTGKLIPNGMCINIIDGNLNYTD